MYLLLKTVVINLILAVHLVKTNDEYIDYRYDILNFYNDVLIEIGTPGQNKMLLYQVVS